LSRGEERDGQRFPHNVIARRGIAIEIQSQNTPAIVEYSVTAFNSLL
jgi:hypothetical protein